MRTRPLAALASFFLLAVAVPSVAFAGDQPGSAGAVTKVEVNTPSADAYLQYHGRMFVQTGKTSVEYRWGGTSCGTKTVDANLVDTLLRLSGDSNLYVAPSFQDGQGGAKCLVGFAVMPKR